MDKHLTLEYLGYKGRLDSELSGDVMVGSVVGTKSKISFAGATFGQLRREMKRSVDGYLSLCEKQGIVPERPTV
jgi:predicted HicB family RNase H-like nuclease